MEFLVNGCMCRARKFVRAYAVALTAVLGRFVRPLPTLIRDRAATPRSTDRMPVIATFLGAVAYTETCPAPAGCDLAVPRSASSGSSVGRSVASLL